ncbi:polysaccharide biosynthesis tyrosine autokinase [Chelativorans sp. M5D2P16]|uniref:GumC family protein n=1 Tax=Chelativorans sp. M5D2P16 TaxID=3095678 RepID=UPI002ACAC82A|nr:polysaccharide biosynthesis tyrosine autokinase [Chelativorans sp. M5D2P16]MDZ5696490.1 polysaccharide biosynthesis tyrosine autokinase [Chelativorans sp. M5D2P16]
MRRKYFILSFVLVSAFLLAIAVMSMANTYTAASTLVLERNDTRMLEAVTQLESEERDRAAIETEMDIISSRVFVGRVVDAANLVEHPWFNTYLRVPDSPDTLPERVVNAGKAVLGSILPFDFFSEDRALPSQAAQRDRAISSLVSRMTVSRSGESFAVTVRVSSPDPELSAMLANTIADVYVEWSRELKKQAMTEAVAFLRERAEKIAEQIAESERIIAEFSRVNGLSSDERDDLLRKRIDEMSTQLTTARVELAAVRSRQEQARRVLAGTQAAEGTALDSQLLGTLRSERAVLLRKRAQHAANLGANHPKVVDTDAELDSVNAMIDQEYQRILDDLSGEEQIIGGRVDQFESQIAQMQEMVRKRNVAEIRLRELERDLVAEQKMHDLVVARLGDLDPFSEITKPSARVVSVAEVPTKPSFPQKDRILAGGIGGATVLAVILAILLEAVDTRISSGQRIRQVIQVPNLANVPAARGWMWWKPGATHDIARRPRAIQAEAFRSLYLACRAQLAMAKPVMLVTAPLPGDGASTVALGLARAAACDGLKTIHVILDPHRQQFSGGGTDLPVTLNGSNGLTTPLGLATAIRPEPEIEGLDRLDTASFDHGKMGPLTRSKDMRLLIDRLRVTYDFVVIDCAPALVTEDANWMAPLVDAVLLVVRFGRTTEQELTSAVQRLHLNRAPLLGTVLNGVNPRLQTGDDSLSAMSYPRQARAYLEHA